MTQVALNTSIASTVAAYELGLLVRQALSLGGVVGSALYVVEAAGHLRNLTAASVESTDHPLASDPSGRGGADFPDLFASETGAAFAASALASPGLHEAPLEESLAYLPSAVHGRMRESLGAAWALLARLEAEGGPLGIMLFLLDHPTTVDERQVIQAFAADASRALDSLLHPDQMTRHRHRQRLGVLLGISEAAVLSKDSELSTTLQAIVERLRTALSADVAMIESFSEDGQTASASAVSVSEAGGATGVVERIGEPLSTGIGVMGWVARTGRPALVANLASDPRGRPRPNRPAESVMAAPFSIEGKLTGVLRVSVLQAAQFGPSELQLVELLAKQVAIAVENARLFQSVRDQNAELFALYQQTHRQKNRLAVFGHMFAASPEAITLVGPDERIQECNPAAERLYGFDANELIGKPINALVGEANTPDFQAVTARTLQLHGEWHGELRERRKDGSEFFAEVDRSLVHDESGRAIGSINVTRDLTERKQLEAQSLQSEKLRSLGVMASGVAHQMNNVLASVVGQADVLRADLRDPNLQQRLDAIIQAAQGGAEAVRRIQRFSRNAPQERFESVNLQDLVEDVARAVAPRLRDAMDRTGHPVELLVEAQHTLWTAGLASDLREVVMNLVLNAVDALPKGGTITIGLQPVGELARLTVEDNGVGMPENIAARVFEPFFTTKPAGKGTGLGLALAYGTVQRHRGRIQVQSSPDRGTQFEVLLPRIPSTDREPPTAADLSRVRPAQA